jgi:small-conductance mechanosensitive channel
MYIHPKLAAFTETLEALFHEVDEELEDLWGASFPLHPNRPARGATFNPEMDGLFDIAPDFTVGIGSKAGRGYIVSIRVATLEQVSPAQLEYLMELAARLLRQKLPVYFPGRKLDVVRDGPRFKIIGDFSLGAA